LSWDVSAFACGCLDPQPELFVSILPKIISQATTSSAEGCVCCLGVGACRKLSVFIWYILLHMHYNIGGFQRKLKSYLVSNPPRQVGKLQQTSSSFKPCSEMVLLCLRMVEPNIESQNHRMVAVGRDLCGSSSPTPNMLT